MKTIEQLLKDAPETFRIAVEGAQREVERMTRNRERAAYRLAINMVRGHGGEVYTLAGSHMHNLMEWATEMVDVHLPEVE